MEEEDAPEPDVALAPVSRALDVAPAGDSVEPTLLAHWLMVYALLVAAARFIPIPILDDWVPVRLKQLMVRMLLRHTGRTYPSRWVSVLYAGDGCLDGCVGMLILLPLKLVSYPIRKVIVVVRALHGLSRRVVETFLLGRTVARCLGTGRLGEGDGVELIRAQAGLIRKAFDRANSESNPVLFTSPLEAAWGSMRGVWLGAARLAFRTARKDPTEDDTGEVGEEGLAKPLTNEKVDEAVSVFEDVLARADVEAFLRDFDARFDAALEELEAEVRRYGLFPLPERVQHAADPERQEQE